jgi:DNA-3-methyladenine glycosylase II
LISADARLRPVIDRHHCHLFSPEGLAEQIDPFDSLVSSIIGQQVSGAAARSIKNKFLDLFDTETGDLQADTTKTKRRFPTPAQVAKLDIPTLRTAGFSQRKAEYIQGLAEKFSNGELSTEKLLWASDEEVMEMLIAVRGLGRWSVEMFSCFALKRTDVFSTGDLGVQYVYVPLLHCLSYTDY